ncbi:MAG: regulatory protein RecX [Candidatus Omnitrophota bacterium]
MSVQKARAYAFLLLKFRLRSEKELYERLRKKKFDEAAIKEVLVFLKERKFIDDNLFAKTWIESRLKKPLGFRRLTQELKLKGIEKEIIDTRIEEVRKGYSEADIVGRLAKMRLKKLKNIDTQKAKMRVYGYLLRRGFSPEIVSDAITKS